MMRNRHLKALPLLVAGLGTTFASGAEPLDYFPSSIRAPYVSWLLESPNRGMDKFENSAFLPSSSSSSADEGVAVHWTIDDASATIRLAVAAPATGWVGFGIGEAGGMPGSDIVMYNAATDTVTDAHVGDSYVAPTPDVNQDWTLLHSQVEDGFIIFEAERLIDTGDPQDRAIGFDGNVVVPPHRVIAAWGDSEDFSHHGDKRARSALRFYAVHSHSGREEDIFADEMAEQSEGYIDLVIDNHQISSRDDTEYVDVCFSYQDLIDRGMPADVPLHIVGFEPVIDSAKHVHHIVMYGSSYQGELIGCDQEKIAFAGGGMTMTWGYAPGAVPQELPEEAGIPLGAEGGYNTFYMNYHYDNRWGDESVDSSGVRIYYTSQKRKYDAGILQLGDPLVQLDGEPVGQGLARHDFACPSSCTSFGFKEEVTVFKEVLHMHETGAKMSNEVIRNGEVIRRASVEYFDFEQAGLHEMVQDTFTLKPGDSFKSTCFFDTTAAKRPISYGYGSQDEMCIAYMHYYPKQKLPLGVCGADWFLPTCSATHTVEPMDEIERLFGVPPIPNIGGNNEEEDETSEESTEQDTSSAFMRKSSVEIGALVSAAVLGVTMVI